MEQAFTSFFRSTLPFAIFGCLIPLTAEAQISADGTTSTTVNQNGNDFTIDQGDRVNDNLFHSFNEFSVPTLGSAVFNNASDIANIFSRVTGSNISSIDGLLSAKGAANLFLINPNGIIFGENAQLNLGGSFFASTADSLLFEGNAEFSASNPQAAPLLEVSIPIGLNFREEQPGNLANAGNLAVGQDLTLEAGNLDLQGQLKAGRNLTLKAQDTVSLRDNATQPFKAEAGGELLVQGEQAIDLSGLNNINSELFSGRDLVFRSPNRSLSSNAVYTTGGIFRTEQLDSNVVDFIIPHAHDRVIRNNGDVTQQDCPGQDCSGSSLIILAGGNVTLDDVKIENSPPESRANQYIASDNVTFNELTEKFTLADKTNTISVRSKDQPALYIRAGNDLRNLPGLLSGNTTPNNVNSATNGNITVDSIDTSSLSLSGDAKDGGAIALDAIGDISTGDLDSFSASNTGNASNGGNITLRANGNISIGNLISSSASNSGNASNGGNIILRADGNIETGNLTSASDSQSGNTSNGGNIILRADGNIETGNLTSVSNSQSGNAGNGGNITLTAGSYIETLELFSSSQASETVNEGNGGNISISADSYIETLDLFSESISDFGNVGKGGNITLTAGSYIETGSLFSDSFTFEGNAGNGGNITLTAGGYIETGGLFSSSDTFEGNAGNGGNIALTAGGYIETVDLLSQSDSDFGNAGNGGEIAITAGSYIETVDLFSISGSTSGNAGNGGAITLNAKGDIETVDLNSNSISETGNAGNGGNITLRADGNMTTGDLFSGSVTFDVTFEGNVGNAAYGGAITLTAGGNMTTDDLLSSSISNSGNAAYGGAITLTADSTVTTGDLFSLTYSETGNAGNGGKIIISAKDRSIRGKNQPLSVLASVSISEKGMAGNGGDVILKAKGNISDIEILTLSSDSNAGAMQLIGFGDVSVTNTKISTSKELKVDVAELDPITFNAGEKGQSGDVEIISSGNLSFNNSSIKSDTKGSDPAGNVNITSPGLITFNNSKIISDSSSIGDAGSITVSADRGITFADSNSGIFAEASATGKAGDIFLTTDNKPTLDLTLAPGAKISASTSDYGNGGSLIVSAPEAIKITGQGKLAVETTGTGDAGNIELATQKLTLSDGVEISASTSAGAGGTIEVTANTFDAMDGSKLQTTTSGESNAGSITLNVSDNITLAGNNTEFLANTTKESKGNGGSISIAPRTAIIPRTVIIRDGASIAVNSQGEGTGGDIEMRAGSLTLENEAEISAATASVKGGNINLTIAEDIILRNNSLISATALKNADGGNVTINAEDGFILAFTNQNNDIIANAQQGNGGNIDITTQAIFGLEERPSTPPNQTNDIDASSEFGLQGDFSLNTPEVDPTTGLIELPEAVGDASDQIAQNPCEQGIGSEFTITGKGGIPPNPHETLSSDKVRVGLVEPVPSRQRNREIGRLGEDNNNSTSSEQLVPAQGWVFNDKGEVMLTAYQTADITTQRDLSKPNSCSALKQK